MSPEISTPRVFISYTHDSREHKNRVRGLSDRLRREGVDCHIDQYEQSPPEGWPLWMVNQVVDADFVLVICTETYERRFAGKEEPGKGLGGSWEGAVITQNLYDSQAKNTKFLPVIFSAQDADHIPIVLHSATRYQPDTEEGYDTLYRRLTNQPAVLKPELGGRKVLPPLGGEQDSPSILWNVPYRHNPFFTGREDVLQKLRIALTSNHETPAQPQAISGLGGVGKTQVAAEYAHRHRDDYRAVLWIQADSREALVSSFVFIADLLDLELQSAGDQDQAVVDSVKRWLETNASWLLILDNANDLRMIADFIPEQGDGHILLTTQAQATGVVAQRIELKDMEPEEGALLLLRRAKIISKDEQLEDASENDHNMAREISKEVGGLPLALDQAGAFIEEIPSTPAQYLNLYKEEGAKLRAKRGELSAEHPESVTITFSLSFRRVESANPAAADLLRLCAFLASRAIPEEILIKGAPNLGEVLEAVATQPIELAHAIREAGRFSLLGREPGASTLNIHHLVQEVLKDGMDGPLRRIWAGRAVLAVNSAFGDSDSLDVPRLERLIPHARACARLIEELEFDCPERAHLLNKAGRYLYRRARYEEAEQFLEQSLKVRENDLGPDHAGVATATNSLAALYRAQGRWEDSEKLFQRTHDIWSRELGSKHFSVADNLLDWAQLDRDLDRSDPAEEKLQQALRIYEKSFGSQDRRFARALDNRAIVYAEKGDPDIAMPLHQRALDIREETLEPDDPDLAISFMNIGGTHYYLQAYKAAGNCYQKALPILKKRWGLDHPGTLHCVHVLGLAYQAQGQPEETESLYLRELRDYENALGLDHPYVAELLDLYATFLTEMNRHQEAQEIAARADRIRAEYPRQ